MSEPLTPDRSPTRHPTAIIESPTIGSRARIYAFTHIFPGAAIGDDVNINDHVLVENDVTIGNRVTVKSGVQLWDGLDIEDDVFIGPNATFVNDRFPRSGKQPDRVGRTTLRCGCSVGANATILSGVTVGLKAVVGAGAVVTKDVPPFAVVVGNPANIVGYASTADAGTAATVTIEQAEIRDLVGGAQLIALSRVEDLRGALIFAEVGDKLPFVPQRMFTVFGVKSAEVRGEHAHRTLHQFLVCLAGSCHVIIDDGRGGRLEVALDRPQVGLHIPPMVWATQYKHSLDAVLLVLASLKYDADDYIRDYDAFLATMAEL